jgi:hypothetical protein
MKKLFIATALLVTRIANAQPQLSVTRIKLNDCESQLDLSVNGSFPFYAEVDIDYSPFLSPSYYLTSVSGLYPVNQVGNTVQIGSYAATPAGMYHLTLKNLTNPATYGTVHMPVNQRITCYARWAFEPLADYIDPQTITYTGFVDDSDEPEPQNLEVRWTLQEMDMTSGEPVFTLESQGCWAAANHPGASNTFNGFDGFNAETSVSALAAGNNCTSDPSIFDPAKVYCITRSCRQPGNSWVSISQFVGPGAMDEDDFEQRNTFTFDLTTSDLFSLAQNREMQTVTFTTTVDQGTLEIFDATGRRITPIVLQNETTAYTLETALLAKGVYVAHLQSGSHTTVKKFVVE